MAEPTNFPTLEARNGYIIGQMKAGIPATKVAKVVGISKRQVDSIYRTYRSSHRLGRKKGSGRPKLLNKKDKCRLVKTLAINYGVPLKVIIKDYNIPCSVRTAERYLNSIGWSYR